MTDAGRGQEACPPRLQLLLGCGRREQRSFCRLSADPGMPGLRLTLQVGAFSQQLPPRAEQKYRFNGAGGWVLISRVAKERAGFPLLPRSHWDCEEKSSRIPRIVACVSHRALTPRSKPHPLDLFAPGRSVESKAKAFLAGVRLQPPRLGGTRGSVRAAEPRGGPHRRHPGVLPLPPLGAGRRRLFAPAATLPSDAGFLPLAGFSESLQLHLRPAPSAAPRGPGP